MLTLIINIDVQFCEMHVLAIVIVIAVIDSNSKCKHILFAKGLNRRFCWFLLENRWSCGDRNDRWLEKPVQYHLYTTQFRTEHSIKNQIIWSFAWMNQPPKHFSSMFCANIPMKVLTKMFYFAHEKTNQPK